MVLGVKKYMMMNIENKIVRDVFVCAYCKFIYADEPVTSCDCMGSPPRYFKGVASYDTNVAYNEKHEKIDTSK